MEIITEAITLARLREMAESKFGEMDRVRFHD